MKKYFNIIVAMLLLLILGCQQDFLVTPELEVFVEKTTWKVGETITFEFKGNPHFITFYSGVDGQNYDSSINGLADKGSSICNLETKVSEYNYSYSTVGTFTATFIASSNNYEGVKELIKQIQLTIEE